MIINRVPLVFRSACFLIVNKRPAVSPARQFDTTLFRRVARIWKRGGYFERVRSVQTTLTRIVIALESVSHGLHEN